MGKLEIMANVILQQHLTPDLPFEWRFCPLNSDITITLWILPILSEYIYHPRYIHHSPIDIEISALFLVKRLLMVDDRACLISWIQGIF